MAGISVSMKVQKVVDNEPALTRALAALQRQQVLVGVPAEKTDRDTGPITNAALAYIHNFGAPTVNIPPRPFMYPGIANVKDQIGAHMRKAAEAALNGNPAGVLKELHAAGLVAQNGIRIKIQTGPFVPLAASTLAARRRRGRTGTRPLVDTGALLASISYVVRERR